MPTYRFEEKDRVFFFKNDMSDYIEIDTLAIGRVVALEDNLDTPYCYTTRFLVNKITEEEDGLITRTDVPRGFDFNEHQLGFIDSTVYSEDYKFKEDYYRQRQMVKVTHSSFTGEISETDIGVITKKKEGVVWIRTAAGQNSLGLDGLIAAEEIQPLLLKDLDDYHTDRVRYDLKMIGKSLNTFESGGYTLCSVCNDWVWEGSDFRIAGHGIMCDDCYHSFEIECCGCNKTFRIRLINHHYHQNNDYCGSCYDSKVFKCSGCSVLFEEMTPLIYDESRYCKLCYEKRAYIFMSQPPRMLSRTNISKLLLPPDKLYNRNKSKTAVAIEIEAINEEYEDIDDAVYQMPRGWNDTYDGSISSDMSREFIMQPEVGDAALNRVKTFCNWLDSEGWYTDSSCGIHVHTDAFYLGVNELKGILLTARALEPLIYNMLPRSRSESRYSKPMDKIDSKIIVDIKTISELCQLWYEVMNGTHASCEKYNDSRYRGFNLHSRFLHGTIEYRYHHGTISHYYIKNWIMLCLAISDFGATLFSKSNKTINLFADVDVNDIRVLKDYNYTVLLETMGVSNLIPYIEEMISRSTSPPDETIDESPTWRSAQSM